MESGKLSKEEMEKLLGKQNIENYTAWTKEVEKRLLYGILYSDMMSIDSEENTQDGE